MGIINRRETRIEKGTLLDMALSSGSKILVSDITAIQTTANNANAGLANKYDKTGGTISGSISATGNITASGAIKGARISANNGSNNNIDFIHDSKSSGGYYLNFDNVPSDTWYEIAHTGSRVSSAGWADSANYANSAGNGGVTSVNGMTGAVTVSAGTATALSNFAICSFLEQKALGCSYVHYHKCTLPSGGTWRYVSFYASSNSMRPENMGNVSGGTTITSDSDDVPLLIAIRIA